MVHIDNQDQEVENYILTLTLIRLNFWPKQSTISRITKLAVEDIQKHKNLARYT